jgi:16S rRNA A1518/A1519 N6-dimethyltransferase RsmA/KsgA/DIM1 with predicted DNA glycosylase/AP lyase activity
MRFLLATSILASILISSSIAAKAGPLETAPSPAAAPTIVHVQPRAEDFSPHSAANRAERRRLSRFDARQKKLDKVLDRNLSICRC